MPPDPDEAGGPAPPSLLIPEIRDYQKINAELIGLLNGGHRLVRLEGAEGQRLLASGLSGNWQAVVEIVGRTGPELAADLGAPGLTIVARGSTVDGVGRGLRAGQVIVIGDAGDSTGYGQSGGMLVVTGSTGHRAGLMQTGGTLSIFGKTGRLAGDRQAGGRLFVRRGQVGPHAGRGRREGRIVELSDSERLEGDDTLAWREVADFAASWVEPASLPQV